MKENTKTNACQVIDLTKAAYSTYGVGPKRNNPKRCLYCSQLIKRGESWQADTTAEDQEFGRYTVIFHSPGCPDQKAQKVFQKLLANGKGKKN